MKFHWAKADLGARLAIVLLLSFGIGTAMLLFTALDRLLIHPLNVTHPETLVRLVERHPPILSWERFSYSAYEAIAPMHSFEDVAAEGKVNTFVTANGGAQPLVADMVSGNYFSLLGVEAELGRALTRRMSEQCRQHLCRC